MEDHEKWLQENEEARKLVELGLSQAKAGQFAENPPDLEKDLEDLEE